MKIISILISSLLLATNTCKQKEETESVKDGTKTELTSENTKTESVPTNDVKLTPQKLENQDVISTKQDNGLVAEYEAFSRGMFLKVKYSNGQITVFKDRNFSERATAVSITKTQQEELTKLLLAIDSDGLEKMKAPTEARLYDGAAHANLSITANGKKHSCPGFDHGQPPAGVEKFVTKLLSYTQEK